VRLLASAVLGPLAAQPPALTSTPALSGSGRYRPVVGRLAGERHPGRPNPTTVDASAMFCGDDLTLLDHRPGDWWPGWSRLTASTPTCTPAQPPCVFRTGNDCCRPSLTPSTSHWPTLPDVDVVLEETSPVTWGQRLEVMAVEDQDVEGEQGRRCGGGGAAAARRRRPARRRPRCGSRRQRRARRSLAGRCRDDHLAAVAGLVSRRGRPGATGIAARRASRSARAASRGSRCAPPRW
jgi:hypothetical protein